MKKSFEGTMVEQCAPTLAGVKPANLFRYCSQDRQYVLSCVAGWTLQLKAFGIGLQIVKECSESQSFLIYLYRKRWLHTILEKKENQDFLTQTGYVCSNDLMDMLMQLSQRLYLQKEFPHEIGLFLGYPLFDVIGFIENKGQNFTCKGYWKSYGDPVVAQQCFARYKKCFAIYRRLYEEGTPLLRLVVAA